MPKVVTVKPNGPVIREIRERQGLTAEQVGAAIGRNPQSIRRMESNNDRVGRLFVGQVARVLGVSVDELILPEQEEPETNGRAA
jgi:transcriptional regulator with XRE-family HTH domain